MEQPNQTKSPNSEEKHDKLTITLDSPNNTYYTGQTIHGTVSIKCSQKTKIRGIYFRIMGYGKCSWTEILGRDTVSGGNRAQNNERSLVKYSGNEEYLDTVVYIIGSKSGSFSLLEGTTSYKFSFDLKVNLPSTFYGKHGKIKYKLEFVVDKPWKFNEKKIIPLNIIQTVNLNYAAGTLQPFENQLTKSIGIIGSGPISLHVCVPKRGFLCSDKIVVQATVTNNSGVQVEKLKIALYRITQYFSKTPKMVIKQDFERLLKKEVDGMAKKSERKIEQTIEVPVTAPSQEANTSQLIHIKYELRIEAKLGALYKNLIMTIPITIGTIAHSNIESGQAVLRTSVGPQSLDFNLSRLSLFSNWSMDLNSPQHESNRSSMARHSLQYPTTPLTPVNNLPIFSQYPPYQPTAPPADINTMHYNAMIRPHSIAEYHPPSYEQAVGFQAPFNHSKISH